MKAKHSTRKRGNAIQKERESRLLLRISQGLALLAFILYANTLTNQYALDDPLAVSQNPYVTQGISGIPEILTHHYRAGTEGAESSALLYRPLSLITFAIEWGIAPDRPFLNHLMNVLWFICTVVLLFAMLRRLFHKYHWWWAAGAVLLFTVHPIHTEVVANVKSRDELLCAFFCIASLYAWARWLNNSVRGWMVTAIGCYSLALLAKESAVMFLPLFPLTGWMFFQKSLRSGLGHFVIFALPVLCFLLVRAAVFAHVAGGTAISPFDNPIVEAAGYGDRSATGFMVLWKYIWMLISPYPLISDYSFRHLEVTSWSNWRALAGFAIYMAMLAYSVRGLIRKETMAFLSTAFLCGMILYSQLFVVIGTLFSERLLYMPSIWFCCAAAYFLLRTGDFDLHAGTISSVIPPWSKLRVPTLLFALIVVLFGSMTIMRNPDWKDTLSLVSADIAKAPNSVRLQNGMAGALFNAYQNNAGLSALERNTLIQQVDIHARAAMALRSNPESYMHLGNAAYAREQYKDAIGFYENARDAGMKGLSLNTNLGRAYRAWGNSVIQTDNNMVLGARLYEKAIEFGEQDARIYLNLGSAYAISGKPEEAIRIYEQAVSVEPSNPVLWKNLGKVYRTIGNLQRAEECESRARSLQQK